MLQKIFTSTFSLHTFFSISKGKREKLLILSQLSNVEIIYQITETLFLIDMDFFYQSYISTVLGSLQDTVVHEFEDKNWFLSWIALAKDLP